MSFEMHFLTEARNGQWSTGVKAKCAQYSSHLDWMSILPDDDEIEEFLDLAAAIPNLAPQSVLAINDVKKWALEWPMVRLHGIDPNRTAAQLAIRLLWPDSLNQGHCGFCGPTSILFDFLKKYPRKYVKCCMDLIEYRSGRIEINNGILGFDIELTAEEAGDWKEKKLPEADFIMMRAIRKKAKYLVRGSSSGGLDFVFSDADSHATTPWQMATLLKDAGYSRVEENTLDWPGNPLSGKASPEAKEWILSCCERDLGNLNPMPAVIMLIAVELADRALDPVWTPPRGDKRWEKAKKLADLHWIVIEELNIVGGWVVGTMVTWQKREFFYFEKAEFLSLFHGYVLGYP